MTTYIDKDALLHKMQERHGDFDEHDKIVLPRYCSNCSAKMDLEDEL